MRAVGRYGVVGLGIPAHGGVIVLSPADAAIRSLDQLLGERRKFLTYVSGKRADDGARTGTPNQAALATSKVDFDVLSREEAWLAQIRPYARYLDNQDAYDLSMIADNAIKTGTFDDSALDAILSRGKARAQAS